MTVFMVVFHIHELEDKFYGLITEPIHAPDII